MDEDYAVIAVAIMDALADATQNEANGVDVALYVTSGLEDAGFCIVRM